MDLDELRPILSGHLGGLIALLLFAAWRRWLPKGRDGKDASILLLQYKLAIRLANACSFAGLALPLVFYTLRPAEVTDWRPALLGFGIAFSAPLVVLPAVALIRRCSPTEAYLAFALAQRTPVVVLYPLLATGVPMILLATLYG